MTLRPPRPSSRTSHSAALDYEIAQEQASALGRLGRALEAALAALRHYEIEAADQAADPASRAKLIRDASDALWCFIVQRESCGLRDPRPIYRDYRAPPEVQNRMGVFELAGAAEHETARMGCTEAELQPFPCVPRLWLLLTARAGGPRRQHAQGFVHP